MTIFLDAVGTLIRPSERVGQTYARQLEELTGQTIQPDRMQETFQRLFASGSSPDYQRYCSGHAAERAWWSELVWNVLVKAGVHQEMEGEDGMFETFFNSLFQHYSSPSAWQLYPETMAFLEAACRLGPLAVLSNFDDRLKPVLDGLDIGLFFEHVFTSAEVQARKPDPIFFGRALERLNCAPQDTFHCGDSFEADYQGAAFLGINAFHLTRPGRTLFDFLDFCQHDCR